MKKFFYLLFCFGILVASCNPKPSVKKESPDEPNKQTAVATIPFKPIPPDTAREMIKRYQKTPPKADTNYREFPRLIAFDPETLKSFTKGAGVRLVRFVVGAYIDSFSTRLTGLKNTMILQITSEKEIGKKVHEYYDLRMPMKSLGVETGGNTVCPLPDDCYSEDK